jgi:hypothetical protein
MSICNHVISNDYDNSFYVDLLSSALRLEWWLGQNHLILLTLFLYILSN